MHAFQKLVTLAGAVVFPASILATSAARTTPVPANVHWKRDISHAFAAQPSGFTNSHGVVHLPLKRWARSQEQLVKRQGMVQVPFGDDLDTEYGVNVKIGQSNVPLQLDTGSSDLWAASAACQSKACTSAPDSNLFFKPDSSFTNLSVPFFISYQDTTAAYGSVGRDLITFGDIAIPNTVVAAVDQTNVTLYPCVGLIGVSFPINSQIVVGVFNDTIHSQSSGSSTQNQQAFIQSWQTNGGPASKLAETGNLSSSSFSITLQRTIGPESDAGIFTLGGLPSGVSASSLTYSNVSLYNATVFTPFTDPDWSFVFDMPFVPAAWNIPIDGVIVNGKMLPNSTLPGAQAAVDAVGVIALIDSGTTDVVAPSDLVQEIFTSIGADPVMQTVDCSIHFNMSIVIQGKSFDINPIDWVTPTGQGNQCGFSLQGKGVPTVSDHSSYVLGDVFMKNVLAHFDYGDLSNLPQSKPARIGLLSTTDKSAADAQYNSLYPVSAATFAPTGTTIAVPTQTTSVSNPVSAGIAKGTAESSSSRRTNGGLRWRVFTSWTVGMIIGVATLFA